MLIQVKSSKKEETIEQLDSDQEKVFNELAKYLKEQIKESKLTKAYADKPVVISTGYAGVKRTKSNSGKLSHKLVESKMFNFLELNGADLNTKRVSRMIASAHSMG